MTPEQFRDWYDHPIVRLAEGRADGSALGLLEATLEVMHTLEDRYPHASTFAEMLSPADPWPTGFDLSEYPRTDHEAAQWHAADQYLDGVPVDPSQFTYTQARRIRHLCAPMNARMRAIADSIILDPQLRQTDVAEMHDTTADYVKTVYYRLRYQMSRRLHEWGN